MAFKQGNNPLSRKASPMRMSPFKKEEPSMSMDELQKMSAAQDAASKAQADKLPQIEKPGFDYEMDQDMSYPGGERGRDYDEEGTKDGMSRNESPLNATRAERRMSKTKDKAAEAKKDASRTNKEGGTIETQARARAKAKRLDKRAERQEDRAERKEKRKSKKAKLSKANRGVAVTSVGSVKSSGIKKDVKSSDSDIQDSTRAKVKKSLA